MPWRTRRRRPDGVPPGPRPPRSRAGRHGRRRRRGGQQQLPQSNGLRSTMVCSRSGPVEMMATSVPVTSCMRLR